MEYKFEETNYSIDYNIIFLCGVKFNKTNDNDKRNVLKRHIETLSAQNRVIILEENFVFSKPGKTKLAYDDIFMKNLYDVETLTSLFSDSIIIVHEGISTGTELGMFASNQKLRDKICLLVPDEFIVEENKITSFIELAFLREPRFIETIIFYPQRKAVMVSDNKVDWHTNFLNNQIGENLSTNIEKFVASKKQSAGMVRIRQVVYGNPSVNQNDIIEYNWDEERRLNVYVSSKLILLHLIALFSLDEFRQQIRDEGSMEQHVSVVQNFYGKVLLNSISEKIAQGDCETIKIKLKDHQVGFRETIAFALYILQAIKFIKIERIDDSALHKIIITKDLMRISGNYSGLISEIKPSKFSRSYYEN
ncbi:MAG: hypothetical protein ACI3XA_03230 [Clostridia bacterium]